jgi:two-component system sensor histidine kinase YesM
MIIPTVYSIIILNIHTKKYDQIITNVSYANDINQIAKTTIPDELWDIVCGRKDFAQGNQYIMLSEIFSGIQAMKMNSKDSVNQEKLEVAFRTCTTLSNNIKKLEQQINKGYSVKENEAFLDDIRTITALFSDVMQDFIMSEISIANQTNKSIKISSITLTILQIIILLFSVIISMSSFVSASKNINSSLADMKDFSSEIAQGNLSARTSTPDLLELKPLAKNMNIMASQIDLLIKKNIEEEIENSDNVDIVPENNEKVEEDTKSIKVLDINEIEDTAILNQLFEEDIVAFEEESKESKLETK